MAGLQASSKFPVAPATMLAVLPYQKDPEIHTPGFDSATQLERLAHSVISTHSSEHLPTLSPESSGGRGVENNSGSSAARGSPARRGPPAETQT